MRHEIGFITNAGGAPVTGRIDIGVNAQSDLGRDETRIIFRVNDEVVQTSDAAVYTFDASALQPGFYTIQAELWDSANNTLARTPSALRLYVQQPLVLMIDSPLSPADGAMTSTFSGASDFTVRGSPRSRCRMWNFSVPRRSLELAQRLGTAP